MAKFDNDNGIEALRNAAEKMEQAVRRLLREESAKEEQGSLDQLREAKAEIDALRAQADSMLAREQREQAADVVKHLRERQVALVTETVRIRARGRAKQWLEPRPAS